MIDPTRPLASWYLWIASLFFLVFSALPILFFPLAWAKRQGWRVPDDPALTAYFGRCVGALTLAVVLIGMEAAPHPRAHPLVFDLIILGGALQGLVHLWGAVRRTQPLIETLEIAFYAALTASAVWVKSGL